MKLSIEQLKDKLNILNTDLKLVKSKIKAHELIRRNISPATFHKQSKMVQRLLICLDVLKRVDDKEYLPTHMTYVALHNLKRGFFIGGPLFYQAKIDARNLLNQIKKEQEITCHVCVMGAAFCSLLQLGDKLKITDEVVSYESVFGKLFLKKGIKELSKYFSEKELFWLEYLFESAPIGEGQYDSNKISFTGSIESELFHKVRNLLISKDAQSRLIWLFTHLFNNNGFDLEIAKVDLHNEKI